MTSSAWTWKTFIFVSLQVQSSLLLTVQVCRKVLTNVLGTECSEILGMPNRPKNLLEKAALPLVEE